MIGLVIFDWDDVVTLGAKEGYYACYRETLHDLGVVLPEDELHRRIQKRWGQPYPEELRELLVERPLDIPRACDLFAEKFWGDTFVGKLSEVPGANEALSALSTRYALAVSSGNHPDMLKKIAGAFGIPDVFRKTITSFDVPVEKTKPHPYMLLALMEELGYGPNETLYIGDAETDVRMAHAAGVEPVVVLTGHLNREQAAALGVVRVYADLTEACRAL